MAKKWQRPAVVQMDHAAEMKSRSGQETGRKSDPGYKIYLTGKIARGVELFYAAMEGQSNDNKRLKVGFPDALVKAVGEANRGSL
jgi:hypothetical protein